MRPAIVLLAACQLSEAYQMSVNTGAGAGSTVSRARTISVIRVPELQAEPWKDAGRMQQKRPVRLTLSAGPVLKGAAPPAARVAVTVEQWRDSGPRVTAPRTPWSGVALAPGEEFVVFSGAASGRWAEEIIPAVTQVRPASTTVEQVRAALALDWQALHQLASDSPAWGPLLAGAVVEQTLSFSSQPSLWDRSLSLLERQGLPREFRDKAASDLFAKLGLIAPLPLPIAQRTMLFGLRILAIPEVGPDLRRALVSVYFPNLRQLTAGGKPSAADLLPVESDRKRALDLASALHASPERDRFIEWLRN